MWHLVFLKLVGKIVSFISLYLFLIIQICVKSVIQVFIALVLLCCSTTLWDGPETFCIQMLSFGSGYSTEVYVRGGRGIYGGRL